MEGKERKGKGMEWNGRKEMEGNERGLSFSPFLFPLSSFPFLSFLSFWSRKEGKKGRKERKGKKEGRIKEREECNGNNV